MLELVNNIHIEFAEPENKYYPFGGKQMIIVGEFLQLNPVPSYFDKGNFMFLAPLFTFAINHRVQLTTVMRQNKSERKFLSALNQVRLGVCSDETDSFLISLARPLSYDEQSLINFLEIFVVSMSYVKEICAWINICGNVKGSISGSFTAFMVQSQLVVATLGQNHQRMLHELWMSNGRFNLLQEESNR
ncbi:ATP-dependent DNA helicase PIF1 [Paramuricea clavata]|uniref:ATP-dependent DNA helicase n=1 Tax=Paramuricea clavata TaxID=317549 RepID=A0A7D9ISR4_PARCT|nr:ATP-dependent DNA helicase PIF1 [Paramuricea clavata]